MKRRLLDINPACNISLIHDFVSEDNIDDIFTSIPGVTACLVAIDGSIGKSSLIAACARHRIPIVTCGGFGIWAVCPPGPAQRLFILRSNSLASSLKHS